VSDFFADLEAQLVAAHPRRRRARALAAVPAAAGMLAVVGAGAALALSLGDEPAAPPRPAATASVPTTPLRIPAGAPPVTILNGTTRTGLARVVATRLAQLGLTIGAVSDAPPTRGTLVLYGPGGRATAIALAARLRPHAIGRIDAAQARRYGLASGTAVAVVLGADARVPALSPPPAGAVRELRGTGGASGFVVLRRGEARPAIEITATGLPGGRELTVALVPRSGRPRVLGRTPEPRGGRIHFQAALPDWAGRSPQLIVTRIAGSRVEQLLAGRVPS